ncbi:MAG: hypothetical protein VX777_01085 [Chlamydiota bacterium]|nr:hypothetical protein [Chlamydiota bacterium]
MTITHSSSISSFASKNIESIANNSTKENLQVSYASSSMKRYPKNAQGEFFLQCLRKGLITTKGDWTSNLNGRLLPPVSQFSYQRIVQELQGSIDIHKKDLLTVPTHKLTIVYKYLAEIEMFCKDLRVSNPFTFCSKKRFLSFDININRFAIINAVYRTYKDYIQSIRIYGGAVPPLLGKEFYRECITKAKIHDNYYSFDERLLEGIDEPASDLDIKIIMPTLSYDQLGAIYAVVLEEIIRTLDRQLLPIKDRLVWLLRETVFSKFDHVCRPEDVYFNHYQILSFGGPGMNAFDLTFEQQIANNQLFHSHGLYLEITSLFTSSKSITEYRELQPSGEICRGWKSVFDRLAKILTVSKPNHPYYQVWHRMLTFIPKGYWLPDESTEMNFLSHIQSKEVGQVYKDLIKCFRSHHNSNPLSVAINLINACISIQVYLGGNVIQFMLDKFLSENNPIKSEDEDLQWILDIVDLIQKQKITLRQSIDLILLNELIFEHDGKYQYESFNYCNGNKCNWLQIQLKNYGSLRIPLNRSRAIHALSELKTNKDLDDVGKKITLFFLKNKEGVEKKTDTIFWTKKLIDTCERSLEESNVYFGYLAMALLLTNRHYRIDANFFKKLLFVINSHLDEALKISLLTKFELNVIEQGSIGLFIRSIKESSIISLSQYLRALIRGCKNQYINVLYKLWKSSSEDIAKEKYIELGWDLYNRLEQENSSQTQKTFLVLINKTGHLSEKCFVAFSILCEKAYIKKENFENDMHLPTITEAMLEKIKPKKKRRNSTLVFKEFDLLFVLETLISGYEYSRAWFLIQKIIEKRCITQKKYELGILTLRVLQGLYEGEKENISVVAQRWHEANDGLQFALIKKEEKYHHFLLDLLSGVSKSTQKSSMNWILDELDQCDLNPESSCRLQVMYIELIDEDSKNLGIVFSDVKQKSKYFTAEKMQTFRLKKLESCFEQQEHKQSSSLLLEIYDHYNEQHNQVMPQIKSLSLLMIEHLAVFELNILCSVLSHKNVHLIFTECELNQKLLECVEKAFGDKAELQKNSRCELLKIALSRLSQEDDNYCVSLSGYISLFYSDHKNFDNKEVNKVLIEKNALIMRVLAKKKKAQDVVTFYGNLVTALGFKFCDQESSMITLEAVDSILTDENTSKKDLAETLNVFIQIINPQRLSIMSINYNAEDTCTNFIEKLSQNQLWNEIIIFSQQIIKSRKQLNSAVIVIKKILNCLIQNYPGKATAEILCDVIDKKMISSKNLNEFIVLFIHNRDSGTSAHLILDLIYRGISLNIDNESIEEFNKSIKDYFIKMDCETFRNDFIEVIQRINKMCASTWIIFFQKSIQIFSKECVSRLNTPLINLVVKKQLKGSSHELFECWKEMLNNSDLFLSEVVDKIVENSNALVGVFEVMEESHKEDLSKCYCTMINDYLSSEQTIIRDKSLKDCLLIMNQIIKQTSGSISNMDTKLLKTIIGRCSHSNDPDCYELGAMVMQGCFADNQCKWENKIYLDFIRGMKNIHHVKYRELTTNTLLEALIYLYTEANDSIDILNSVCKSAVDIESEEILNQVSLYLEKLLELSPDAALFQDYLYDLLDKICVYSSFDCINRLFQSSVIKKSLSNSEKSHLRINYLNNRVARYKKTNEYKNYGEFIDNILSEFKHCNSFDDSFSLLLKNLMSLIADLLNFHVDINLDYLVNKILKSVNEPVDKPFWDLYSKVIYDFCQDLLSNKSVSIDVAIQIVHFTEDQIRRGVESDKTNRLTICKLMKTFTSFLLYFDDEGFFDFAIKRTRAMYELGLEARLFNCDLKTLLHLIYISELKDCVTLNFKRVERKKVFESIIFEIAETNNHIALRHGFTMLACVSRILYSDDLPRVIDLYSMLIEKLPMHVYKKVHYFLCKNTKQDDECGLIQEQNLSDESLKLAVKTIGSFPSVKEVQEELEKYNVHKQMVPLFECVRQTIMPGDILLFANSEDSKVRKLGIDLLHNFISKLIIGHFENPVPKDENIKKFHLPQFICDVIEIAAKFNSFVTCPYEYYTLLTLIHSLVNEWIAKVADDQILEVCAIYESLLFTKIPSVNTPEFVVLKHMLVPTHLWIKNLLQSDEEIKRKHGKCVFEKALKKGLYKGASDCLSDLKKYFN